MLYGYIFHNVKYTADLGSCSSLQRAYYSVYRLCNTLYNAGVVTDYYGSAKADTRICRYCHGLPWISITPIVLGILKHPGSIPDRHRSPMSCHGLAKYRQGLVKVSLKPRSHFPGSRPRMWSGWSGSDPGWSGAHPWLIRFGPGQTGVIRVDPWLEPGLLQCLIQPALALGLIRVVRDSSGTQPGSPGLVRGSSLECWSRTSHGLAPDKSRTTPGWLPDYSRMSPGIPGRVTDEHGWPTDELGLATDDPGLARNNQLSPGWLAEESRMRPVLGNVVYIGTYIRNVHHGGGGYVNMQWERGAMTCVIFGEITWGFVLCML